MNRSHLIGIGGALLGLLACARPERDVYEGSSSYADASAPAPNGTYTAADRAAPGEQPTARPPSTAASSAATTREIQGVPSEMRGYPTEASAKLDDSSVDDIVRTWPSTAQKAAREMIRKYGAPSEVSSTHLVWRNNAPWKATVVQQEEIPHEFPEAHKDVLEQCVEMRVPADMVGELARFDGSILVDRTRGTVGSRCDQEEMNFLALNLANDILQGRKTPQEARDFLALTASNFRSGELSSYTQGLLFTPARGGAADPDTPAGDTRLHTQPIPPAEGGLQAPAKPLPLDKHAPEHPEDRDSVPPSSPPSSPQNPPSAPPATPPVNPPVEPNEPPAR